MGFMVHVIRMTARKGDSIPEFVVHGARFDDGKFTARDACGAALMTAGLSAWHVGQMSYRLATGSFANRGYIATAQVRAADYSAVQWIYTAYVWEV